MSRSMSISMTTTSLQPSTTSTLSSPKNSSIDNGNNGPTIIGSTTPKTNHLSTDEMIEMLKNLAAVNEKLYKWEQSLKKLDLYPNNDINKSLMKDIIDL